MIAPLRLNSGPRIPLVCLLVSFLLIGCARTPTPISETPPPVVTVGHPIERDFADFAEFTGRTEAKDRVEIQARVSGYLDKVNFEEGEKVEANDVLFEIDPRPYKAAYEAAQADVLKSEAELSRSTSELARMTELNKQGAITKDELDTVVADEAVGRANVEAAKAALRQADLDVEFTTVTSPVAGRVGRANLTEGNLVSSASLLGQPLTTVVSTAPIHVYFDVDERTFLKAQEEYRKEHGGMNTQKLSEVNWPVFIKLANETSFEHEGVLDFIDNEVNPETGTIRMRGEFKNEDEKLLSGLFVTVKIPLGKPRPHVLIPSRAIGTDQGNKYVLVVDDQNTAQYRLVEPGVRTDDGLQEIITGLEVEDRVVIDGLQRAQPGTTVTPRKPEKQSETDETDEPENDAAAPADGGSATTEPDSAAKETTQ